ncbi:hypothetical protein LOX59_00165 [Latilactobacillus curvatus]|uniref:hypothetical protein n=1 Tax=Latilactobacillus curvatus TaxID=28038 RepID=UPI0020C7BD66|nr:hypothetical protein [Latilactobacillus curvatus]MCP8876496.1 hypothetical protein [Latilactobacillus curvatus]
MVALDLTGQQFGELKVIVRDGNIGNHAAWLCQCSCGNQTTVPSNKLKSGAVVSCGHLKRDVNHTGLRRGYQDKKKNGVATFLLDSKRKVRSDSSTGVTGVKVVKYRDGSIHYAAEVTVKGNRHRIGTFPTVEEAAQARQAAVDALLNDLND